jgi:hypothetical protein
MYGISPKATKTRFVEAPSPTAPYIIPSIYGIELHEDEEVEWCWLDLPDGNRVVIDCKIHCHNHSHTG